MQQWGKVCWSVFIFVIAFIVFLLSLLYEGFVAVGILKYYAIWLVVVIALFAANTYRLSGEAAFHLHHYTLAMILQVLLSQQSMVITIIQGFFAGVMVEGGSRWGYDPIWTPLHFSD